MTHEAATIEALRALLKARKNLGKQATYCPPTLLPGLNAARGGIEAQIKGMVSSIGAAERMVREYDASRRNCARCDLGPGFDHKEGCEAAAEPPAPPEPDPCPDPLCTLPEGHLAAHEDTDGLAYGPCPTAGCVLAVGHPDRCRDAYQRRVS